MDDQLHFRPPTSADAAAMRFLARDSRVLSVNSTYYYALMARHFQQTCMVAENSGVICGYVIGYSPPEQPDTLFVWQVGVARQSQGQGLGKKLLIALVKARQPVYVEATIAPDNQASINLFRALARLFEVDHSFSEQAYFSQDELGGDQAENLMHLGPFS